MKIKNLSTMIAVVLIATLFGFLPLQAQETGELRNNPITKEIEIFINETNESIEWQEGKDYWTVKVDSIKQWCNVDSLYKANGGNYQFGWVTINLAEIVWQKKLYELFSKENKSKNSK
jgi:hypothetical protein